MGLLRGPDGQIVNLPDEQVGSAIASGYEPVSLGAAADTTAALPKQDTGLTGDLGAAASSFLSGATLGTSDLALKHILPPAGYKQLAADREDHPWISGAGQLVGTIAPSLASGGTLTPAGYLSSVTQEAAEGGLGKSLVAAGFEGATQNAGAYLADAALGDRDATAEGMVGALGTGFAFGAGGGAAAHGVEAGTIAARRMFARVMDGGPEAAQAAEQAWKSTSQEVLEAHDQAAEIAKAKLAAARTAREQAAVARDQASAGLAEAKLAAPGLDADHAAAVGLDQAIGKVPDDLAAFAQQAANPTAVTTGDVESLHDLAQKVDAYTAARRELDEMMARVEPDHELEDAMGRFEVPSQIQTAAGDVEGGVPRGEFGEPGKGGFKSQNELGRLAAERGDVAGMAEGTPSSLDRTVGSRPANAAKAEPTLDLDTAPVSELSALRDRINDEVKSYFSANGHMSGLPEDLAKRAEYSEQIDNAIIARNREAWGFQRELLPYSEVEAKANRLRERWLKASRDGSSYDLVRSLETSYDYMQKVVDLRRELNSATPGEIIAVNRLGVGKKGGISMKSVEGKPGQFRSDDGSLWSVTMAGESKVDHSDVITAGHHAMFSGLAENRLARAMDPRIAEVRIGYIDGVPHLLQKQVAADASAARTNPLIGAWAKDALAARLETGPHGGSGDIGPAMRDVMSSVSADEGRRYAADLAAAYDQNKEAIDKAIEESELSADAKERIRSRARDQITLLLRGGGAVAALTAGAAAAQASESTTGDRTGAPTDEVADPALADGLPPVEKGKIRLFRASDSIDGDVGAGAHLTPELDTATAYLNNDGFGGRRLHSYDVDPDHVLDLHKLAKKGMRGRPLLRQLAEDLDLPEPAEQAERWFEEGIVRPSQVFENDAKAAKSARHLYNWVKFEDDFPEGAETWLYTGDDHIAPSASLNRRSSGSAVARGELSPLRPEPPTELEKLLQGTKSRLDSGEPLGKIASESPAREAYVLDKAATRDRQAAEFRAAAMARRAATEPETDLERALRGTKEGLDSGKSMRDLRMAKGTGEHPLAIKQLELAHDEALDRAAAAPDPVTRSQAMREAKAIEREMTKVGARPGAVEDVAAMAGVVTKVEKAGTELTEALGKDAPPTAQKAAAAYRDAESVAERKTLARTARAADDHAASIADAVPPAGKRPARMAEPQVIVDPATGSRHLVHPETGEISPPLGEGFKDRNPGPTGKSKIDEARATKLRADADLANARAAEGKARIEARTTARTAKDARAAAESGPVPNGRVKTSFGSKLVTAAKVAGAASALGIPGIPSVHDIPVIGPLLSAYIKYRTLKAAAGRFVGRVPATADARAAALAAKVKDAMARAVDRSLGLVERNQAAIRASMVAASAKAGEALQRRAIDDGHPNAPKGATTSELAAVRMREVAAAATDPSIVTKLVRSQMRDVIDPDLIAAAENHLIAMYKHLNDTAPKGPPPNPYTVKPWQPSPAEALQWARRLAVANDPRVALDALETQTLTPEAADTLRAVYPKLFAAAQQRIIQRAQDLTNPVPYRQLLQNSLLFDLSLVPSLDPTNAAILSQAHAKSAPAAPPMGPGAGGGLPSAPPVPSIANTTNISKLYQQTMADRPGMR